MEFASNESILDQVNQAVGVDAARRVFGTPITENGVVLLPVASISISGGGGGGGGSGPADQGGHGSANRGVQGPADQSPPGQGGQSSADPGGRGHGSPGRSGRAEGSGGGFGMSAKGMGVFVLKDGKVTWRPAVDVNRIVLGGQVVAVVALLVVRSLLRQRAGSSRGRRRGFRR